MLMLAAASSSSIDITPCATFGLEEIVRKEWTVSLVQLLYLSEMWHSCLTFSATTWHVVRKLNRDENHHLSTVTGTKPKILFCHPARDHISMVALPANPVHMRFYLVRNEPNAKGFMTISFQPLIGLDVEEELPPYFSHPRINPSPSWILAVVCVSLLKSPYE